MSRLSIAVNYELSCFLRAIAARNARIRTLSPVAKAMRRAEIESLRRVIADFREYRIAMQEFLA